MDSSEQCLLATLHWYLILNLVPSERFLASLQLTKSFLGSSMIRSSRRCRLLDVIFLRGFFDSVLIPRFPSSVAKEYEDITLPFGHLGNEFNCKSVQDEEEYEVANQDAIISPKMGIMVVERHFDVSIARNQICTLY